MSMRTVLFPHFQLSLMFYFPGTFASFHFDIYSRGAQKAHRVVPNEALYGVLRISRLITWTYLHQFCNSFDVIFLPRTGMSL